MRAAIISNITAPYRSELFEHAALELDFLKVYFQAFVEKHRNWEEFPSLPYPHAFLPHKGVRFGSRYLGFYATVRAELEVDRPDVVVSYGFSTAAIGCAQYCKRRGIPFLIANDGTLETDPVGGLEGWYRRQLVRRSQGFIAASSSAAHYFKALGATPEDVCVIPLSCDLIALEESVAAKRKLRPTGYKPSEHGPELCFPTRLVRNKRVLEACSAVLLAARDFPNIRLKIAGDGPLRRELEGWVRANGCGRIELLGMQSWPEILRLYAASDLLLFTGTRERYGMVILEGLASGLPVITYSKAGAAVELIRDGVNGYGVEEGNVAGLAEAIRKAISDQSHYEWLRRNTRHVIGEQDIRIKASEFVRVLRSAAGVSARRGISRPGGDESNTKVLRPN